MNFQTLLTPSAVAVVGASTNPRKVGHAVLKNMLADGFSGKLWAVHPAARSILGVAAFPCLSDIPDQVELAVIAVRRDIVPGIIEECTRAGIPSAIIISAGFSESDEAGRRLQERVVQTARRAKMALMGPNCLGLINPWHKLNASFGHGGGHPGHIALVSQSGALITAMQDQAGARGIGFSVVASIGNKACLDEVDFLENLKNDPHTRVIAAYLEDISRGQHFMRIAEAVSKKKPVIILKAGRTGAGARAASSHTGSLAGADAAYACAFERTGIIRADSIEHLFDVATALAYQPLPAGRRMGIVTNAGGPGIMMTDALEMAGLSVPALSAQVQHDLAGLLPDAASVHNPVDVLGDADGERYEKVIGILSASKEIDGLLVVLTPQTMTDDRTTARAVCKAARESGKPVFGCFMGAGRVAAGVQELRDHNVPQYVIPEQAAAAMKAMAVCGEYRRRAVRVVERCAVNKNPVIKILRSFRNRNMKEIGEFDAKAIMRAYNFDLPSGSLVTGVEEAVRQAEQTGYPLAMKISSPDILHKSDVGGVRIGLRDRQEVEDSFELMMLRISKRMPKAEIRGVMLEEMVTGGREVILGMKRDPQFGPMLMFGLGGIFVEVLKDVTFSLAPVTAEEARGMLVRTRAWPLLKGVRGHRAADIEAIVENIQRLSQLCADFEEIEEVDINPLMVGMEGDGAVCVDARIVIS